MELLILDTNFEVVGILDVFESLIWTDRYSYCGDFEICIPINSTSIGVFNSEYYLQIQESDRTMIIENIQIKTNKETGTFMMISGRSVESILDRRIVWGQKTISGNLQLELFSIINDAIINPSIVNRRIDNFVFEMSTDTNITSLTIDAQFTGDNLYTAEADQRDIF